MATSSKHIQELLEPPDPAVSSETILEDLDSSYSSWDQFESLVDFEQTVINAEEESNNLKHELEDSTIETNRLVAETIASTRTILHSAQDLALYRHSLADDLSGLSEELVSSFDHGLGKPTLLEDLETLQRTLKELESVRSYVSIIEHALRLSEAAIQQVKRSDGLALASTSSVAEYKSLQNFVTVVKGRCSTLETSSEEKETPGLRLVTLLEEIRDKTWADIKATLFATLLAAAERLHWPMPVDFPAASADDRVAFSSSFLNILKLQEIGEALHPPETNKKQDGLYPLQALVQPVSLRFKYHFEGSRPTNRLDKPEWYFTHILNVSHEHRSFMETHVQTLINTTPYRNISAYREFTRLLFSILSRKLRRSLPSLIPHPPLLAQTVYQALVFDASLRDTGFTLIGTSEYHDVNDPSKVDAWDGISSVILDKKDAFDAWLEGERQFAENQYNDIISSPEAWLITDDDPEEFSSELDLRPTNSARRVKALIEQVTDRYQPLPKFQHKTKFLMTIQVPILEQYHARISSSLDAFETLSSSFVRAVPGALAGQAGHGSAADPKRLTSGVSGVQRLLKAFVSARWITIAMEGWGELLFFLELWNEINHRSRLRSKAESNPSMPSPKTNEEKVTEGTLFDELINQFVALSIRAEDMMVRHICSEVEFELKGYLSTPWEQDHEPNAIAVPRTLLSPVTTLSSHLSFLTRSLPSSSVTILYRRIAPQISSCILQKVVFHHARGKLTSDTDCQLFHEECKLWVESCQTALRGAVRKVDVPWARLLDAAILLLASNGDRLPGLTHVVFDGSKDEYEKMVEELRLRELSRDEVKEVMRLRADTRR